MKLYAYKGFSITKGGGIDAPWIARRNDGVKLRADTLKGIKEFVTYWLTTPQGR